MIRQTIIRQLKRLNKIFEFKCYEFRIFEATNCFEAINVLYQTLSELPHLDLLITDECMPNMRGSTLIKLLKQLEKESNFYKLSIISHTAFDTADKKKFISDSGADFILSKPVDIDNLKKVLLNCIEEGTHLQANAHVV